jgi:hypothetical protein
MFGARSAYSIWASGQPDRSKQAGHMTAIDPRLACCKKPPPALAKPGPSTHGFRVHRFAMPRNDIPLERMAEAGSNPHGMADPYGMADP